VEFLLRYGSDGTGPDESLLLMEAVLKPLAPLNP